MKIQILASVMVMGTAAFVEQNTGTAKTPKMEPTIIDVDKKIAQELIRSKQAKLADKGAKVNLEIKSLEKDEESDGLDEFFEDEENEE